MDSVFYYYTYIRRNLEKLKKKYQYYFSRLGNRTLRLITDQFLQFLNSSLIKLILNYFCIELRHCICGYFNFFNLAPFSVYDVTLSKVWPNKKSNYKQNAKKLNFPALERVNEWREISASFCWLINHSFYSVHFIPLTMMGYDGCLS